MASSSAKQPFLLLPFEQVTSFPFCYISMCVCCSVCMCVRLSVCECVGSIRVHAAVCFRPIASLLVSPHRSSSKPYMWTLSWGLSRTPTSAPREVTETTPPTTPGTVCGASVWVRMASIWHLGTGRATSGQQQDCGWYMALPSHCLSGKTALCTPLMHLHLILHPQNSSLVFFRDFLLIYGWFTVLPLHCFGGNSLSYARHLHTYTACFALEDFLNAWYLFIFSCH